jgi:hypothetical protein
VLLPISDWARAHTISTTLAGLLLLTLTVVLAWWQVQAVERPTEPGIELVVPGDHLWPMERHDAYGTLWTEATGPINPTIQWTFEDPERFSGGPVVAAGGTVYIASEGGTLYALDSDGGILWEAQLPAAGVGSPALDAEGKIYVADKAGSLSVFTPDGMLLWRFQPETESSIATTSPIVAPDGKTYYGVRACAQAVSSEGKALWRTCPLPDYRTMPLQLAPSEELLFWKQIPFSAQDGSPVDLETLANVDQYIVGGDGRTYLRDAAKVSLWRRNGSAVEILETTQWDTRMLGTLTQPSDAGVTYDQTVWLFYRFSGFIWLDTGGRVLGFTRVPLNRGQVIALDGDDTAYICGGQSFSGASRLSCLAVAPKREEPVWLMPLEIDGWVKGGALVPGRLYAVVEEQEKGLLYAIGDDER